jgi:DNA invertase Pin-like site-specific DNA recombinase
LNTWRTIDKNEPMKKAGIYLRVSTEDQSFESQEMELRNYCRRRGWKILEGYREKESGAKTTRPELERMLQAVRAGKLEIVVAYKLDRIGRSLTHLALVIDELARLNVALVCTSQGIDTTDGNPAGRLQLGVLMAVAEFERSLIRERTKAGLRAAKARGRALGRPATAAAHRGEVRRLLSEGRSMREVARALGISVGSVARLK